MLDYPQITLREKFDFLVGLQNSHINEAKFLLSSVLLGSPYGVQKIYHPDF